MKARDLSLTRKKNMHAQRHKKQSNNKKYIEGRMVSFVFSAFIKSRNINANLYGYHFENIPFLHFFYFTLQQ